MESAISRIEEPTVRFNLLNILFWQENSLLEKINRTDSLVSQIIPFQIAALGSFIATVAWAYNLTEYDSFEILAPYAMFYATFVFTAIRINFAKASVKLKASSRKTNWLVKIVQNSVKIDV